MTRGEKDAMKKIARIVYLNHLSFIRLPPIDSPPHIALPPFNAESNKIKSFIPLTLMICEELIYEEISSHLLPILFYFNFATFLVGERLEKVL